MKIRFCRNWRNKPHPYWFSATYPGGSWTKQLMFLEVWGRKEGL